MKIRLHENNWTVFVDDFDLKQINSEQVNQIAKLLLTNLVVVFPKQNLTPEDESRICNKFGEIQNFKDHPVKPNFVHKENTDIIRVTGELDEHGEPTGVFGHVSELEWHCNRVSEPDRKPLIWLYAVRGSKGSCTSWLNNILTYQDLSKEQRSNFEHIRLDVGSQVQFTNYLWKEGVEPPNIKDYKPRLVHENILGVKGLFFSPRQTLFIEGMSNEDGRKFIEDLAKFIEQPKYIYDHHWEDGDVVISEQWLSLHKRWEFERMDQRVVHRIAFDYSKCSLV